MTTDQVTQHCTQYETQYTPAAERLVHLSIHEPLGLEGYACQHSFLFYKALLSCKVCVIAAFSLGQSTLPHEFSCISNDFGDAMAKA